MKAITRGEPMIAKRKRLILVIVALLLLLIGLYLYLNVRVGDAQAVAWISFGEVRARVDLQVGETIAIPIRVENAPVHLFEMLLHFDPDIVQVEDANESVEGVQIGAGNIPAPDIPVINMVDNHVGYLQYAIAQNPDRPAKGDGVLAVVTFRAVRNGSCTITILPELRDKNGQELPASFENLDLSVTE